MSLSLTETACIMLFQRFSSFVKLNFAVYFTIDKHSYEQVHFKVEPKSFLYEFLKSGDPLYYVYSMLFKYIHTGVQGISKNVWCVKSVQSALSDLLTTSATHGAFYRGSTKRGLNLIGLELNTNARESFEHCWSYWICQSINMSVSLSHNHKIEIRKSIVFLRQYRGYRFS